MECLAVIDNNWAEKAKFELKEQKFEIPNLPCSNNPPSLLQELSIFAPGNTGREVKIELKQEN